MADEKEKQEEEGEQEEAVRLKTLAEHKYNSSNLKSALKYAKRAYRLNPNLDGLYGMLTAFKILLVSFEPLSISFASETATIGSTTAASKDWYKILQTDPFSHVNTIKKQYKRLALLLHPDKNKFSGSEEAFKLVGEAFRVLSDKIRRKEYDTKLRIAMQSAATEAIAEEPVETFWTACSTCRLLHQFQRKYTGHNLMCPNCKKSFKAIEVSENVEDSKDGEIREEEDVIRTRSSTRIRGRTVLGKRKTSSVDEVLERSKGKRIELSKTVDDGGYLGRCVSGGLTKGLRSKRVEKLGTLEVKAELCNGAGGVIEGLRSRRSENLRIGNKNKSRGIEELERSKTKVDEMMTLAEMQMFAKLKLNEKKMKLRLEEKEKNKKKEEKAKSMNNEEVEEEKDKDKDKDKEETEEDKEEVEKDKEREKDKDKEENETDKGEEEKKRDKIKLREVRERRGVQKFDFLVFEKQRRSKRRNLDIGKRKGSKKENQKLDVVEDSCFYDFDKDRSERKFKKGQVWAIYDDDDKMPRHYGLINEVVSSNPFEVRMSRLDLENDGDKGLIYRGKMGFHLSCGRFKVTWKTSVRSLSIFSHVIDCEKAAREIYRIYPKKGSVWALHDESTSDTEGRRISVKDKQCYDIVVFLTSYSEIHGLSFAYLEKVDGFKTVFRRKEIGCHAIRWLEKDDVRMFSHQIPARKLSGEEDPGLSKDCWELDPASLSPELLIC